MLYIRCPNFFSFGGMLAQTNCPTIKGKYGISFFLFQGKFLSSYETAQENCHLICIPCTDCLQGASITKKFIGECKKEAAGCCSIFSMSDGL